MSDPAAHLALPLVRHPSAAAGWTGSLQACAWIAGGDLILEFSLAGDLARLRLPPFAARRRGERLWEHTCFEAFVGAEGASGYLELNLAPSGEWAAYRFDAYRQGMGAAPEQVAEMSVRRGPARLELAARVRFGEGLGRAPRLLAGLCGVIEETSGALGYWALRHAADRPDFHLAAARVLRLGSPVASPVPPAGSDGA